MRYCVPVFILQSIKPRVETDLDLITSPSLLGLYPTIHQTKGWNLERRWHETSWLVSLSYNPSNQGLKLAEIKELWQMAKESLSYNPSNQGLKREKKDMAFEAYIVFILQSIKPRVETPIPIPLPPSALRLYPTIHQTKGWNLSPYPLPLHGSSSLSYNPSNQGLKHYSGYIQLDPVTVFILQSIKPRVETGEYNAYTATRNRLYPTIHQTKGWNVRNQAIGMRPHGCLYPTIHQTKGWN
mgnify:CR=1 FL=1